MSTLAAACIVQWPLRDDAHIAIPVGSCGCLLVLPTEIETCFGILVLPDVGLADANLFDEFVDSHVHLLRVLNPRA